MIMKQEGRSVRKNMHEGNHEDSFAIRDEQSEKKGLPRQSLSHVCN